MSLKRGLVRNKKYKSAADDDKSGPGYPGGQQWRHFVIHQGPKISGDREGDSIWKPSNTTETTKWGVCYLALRDFSIPHFFQTKKDYPVELCGFGFLDLN